MIDEFDNRSIKEKEKRNLGNKTKYGSFSSMQWTNKRDN